MRLVGGGFSKDITKSYEEIKKSDMTIWVRKASLSSVSSESNHEFRLSRGKMEGKVFQAMGEQGAAEKERLDGMGQWDVPW